MYVLYQYCLFPVIVQAFVEERPVVENIISSFRTMYMAECIEVYVQYSVMLYILYGT